MCHEVLLAIIRKLGFPQNVITFFESYLVGRMTVYSWNAFRSDPRQADVGVGQGSALSPVLSGLYLAPIIHLFYQRSAELGLYCLMGAPTVCVTTYERSKLEDTMSQHRICNSLTLSPSPN